MSNKIIQKDTGLKLEKVEKTDFFKTLSEDIWALLVALTLIFGILIWAFTAPDFKFIAPDFKWADGSELLDKVLNFNNLMLIFGVGLIFGILSLMVVYLSGGNAIRHLGSLAFIYLLALISLIAAGNKTIAAYGVEYVVFALLTGLVLSNVFHLTWLAEAARSEFFIKTGLVILGSSVLFSDIVQAGLPGILQSVFVVTAVWFFSLWLSRKLKVDDEFGVIIASAVSICGVSAAIVASGAIGGDKKKLSYVTTLVLLVAIPMLVFQPWLIRAFHIPELVGGAWLGGTLDTTASVTAAAQLVGPAATKAGVIVKFSQNVLIGIAAFLIATWWILRQKSDETLSGEKPTLRLVWDRFPKFVLGFIAVSMLFSFLIPSDTVKQTASFLSSLRTIWFALAFVSIGLEARFTDLVRLEGGRPALVFVVAQVFNIFWTLLWAYLLFGGIMLAAPDIKL